MLPIPYWQPFVLVAALLSACSSATEPKLQFTGLTLQLNGIPYYVPPRSVGVIARPLSSFNASEFDLVPITVVTNRDGKLEGNELRKLAANFARADDVFQDAFLQSVFVQDTTGGQSQVCDRELRDCVEAHARNLSTVIPNGPYFVSSKGYLFQAYRMYADTQGSFSETCIPEENGVFTVLPANTPGQSLAVAVPSRLYFQPTAEKSLAGVRFGIKDIYDLKGLKTSNGNRAWYSHYPAARVNAQAVQNLLDAGAVIVGKMKTSQFANGETATADWIDYHAPFNPRGDGYQDGSSSSTGPAAGEASYSWLDITLGSDTGGSIRSPSQVQGLYGNRPSHALVSMDGVMPLAPEYDTAGLFARDPHLWTTAAKALYRDNITFRNAYPTSVLAVGFPNTSSTPYEAMLTKFLKNLTDFLSADTSTYNVEQSWKLGMPDEQLLPDLLNNTYELLTAKKQGKLVRDRFYAEYANDHDGRLPHVDPSPLLRWSFGDGNSSTIEQLVAAKNKFMNWFNEEELPRDHETCSKHLLVYVPRTPASKYRDTYLTGPSRPMPFSTSRLSVYSGAPDMVVPIGEVPYHSTISNHIEVLPVTVDIMAAKGCDGMIFSLVQDLHAAGLLATVKTGRSIVTGGDVLY